MGFMNQRSLTPVTQENFHSDSAASHAASVKPARQYSIKAILLVLCGCICTGVVFFLYLTTQSYLAFTQYIEDSQRPLLSIGRSYERMMDTWFELGTMRTDAYLRAALPDPRKEEVILNTLAETAQTLDQATRKTAYRDTWRQIHRLLRENLDGYEEFKALLSKWIHLQTAETGRRTLLSHDLTKLVSSMTAEINDLRNELKIDSDTLAALPASSSFAQILRSSQDLEKLLERYRSLADPERPLRLSVLEMSDLDSSMQLLLFSMNAMLPNLEQHLFSIVGRRGSYVNAINNMRNTFSRLLAEVTAFRESFRQIHLTSLSLEESIHDLHERLSGFRTQGVDLCLTESTNIWSQSVEQTETLLSEIKSRFIVRFIFLAGSMVAAIFSLLLFPSLLAKPLETLRNRFASVQPGQKTAPAEPSVVREISDLYLSFERMVEHINQSIETQNRYFLTLTQLRRVFLPLYEQDSQSTASTEEVRRIAMTTLLEIVFQHLPSLAHAGVFSRHSDERLCEHLIHSSTSDDSQPLNLHNAPAWVHWLTEKADEQREISATDEFFCFGSDIPKEHLPADHALRQFLCLRLQVAETPDVPSTERWYLVFAFSPTGTDLGPTDRRFLAAIGQNLATIVVIAGFLRRNQLQKELEQQLQLAREIQESALPRELPHLAGLEIQLGTCMANEVGGDYCAFFPIDAHRVGILIADVSGKNIPAALLTMEIKATLRSLPVAKLTPRALLETMNSLFQPTMPEGHFITLLYGIVDTAEHTVTLANAGHPPPLLIDSRQGLSITPLSWETMGAPIGLLDLSYTQAEFPFPVGSRLVFYTDGLTDMRDQNRQLFGEKRLYHAVSDLQLTSEELLNNILRFSNSDKPYDDMTVILVDMLVDKSKP